MVTLRLAEQNDFDFFYDLKSEESNIFWTGHAEKPNRDNLKMFFIDAVEKANEKNSRKIFIVENDGEKVGHLYLIPNGDDNFELAPAISEKHRNKGYAREAITLGLAIGGGYGFRRMLTTIREDNIASLKAFKACGANMLDEYKSVYIPKLHKEVRMYFVEKTL